jgi:hypothetical protein
VTAKTTISHLQAFLSRPFYQPYSPADYEAALLADWRQGRPEEIRDDDQGMGTIVSAEGFIGYVGTKRGGEPVTDFRSVAIGRTCRSVFAVDPAGRAYYVGDIRKPRPHQVRYTHLRRWG